MTNNRIPTWMIVLLTFVICLWIMVLMISWQNSVEQAAYHQGYMEGWYESWLNDHPENYHQLPRISQIAPGAQCMNNGILTICNGSLSEKGLENWCNTQPPGTCEPIQHNGIIELPLNISPQNFPNLQNCTQIPCDCYNQTDQYGMTTDCLILCYNCSGD